MVLVLQFPNGHFDRHKRKRSKLKKVRFLHKYNSIQNSRPDSHKPKLSGLHLGKDGKKIVRESLFDSRTENLCKVDLTQRMNFQVVAAVVV